MANYNADSSYVLQTSTAGEKLLNNMPKTPLKIENNFSATNDLRKQKSHTIPNPCSFNPEVTCGNGTWGYQWLYKPVYSKGPTGQSQENTDRKMQRMANMNPLFLPLSQL